MWGGKVNEAEAPKGAASTLTQIWMLHGIWGDVEVPRLMPLFPPGRAAPVELLAYPVLY